LLLQHVGFLVSVCGIFSYLPQFQPAGGFNMLPTGKKGKQVETLE